MKVLICNLNSILWILSGGSFSKPIFHAKDQPDEVLCVDSLLSSSFIVWFLFHVCPFCTLLYSWFPWSAPSCFAELASIMAEVFCHFQASCHCWSDRNSVGWLMNDVDLQPLLGAEEIGGDLVVSGHYRMVLLKVNDMCMTITIVQAAHQLLVGLLFSCFLLCCWVWSLF
jgi:hypothetical protein